LFAPQYKKDIRESVSNGDMTPERGNEAIAFLNTLGEEAWKASKSTTTDGLPLTVKQRRDLTMLGVQKRAVNKLVLDKQLTEVEGKKANDATSLVSLASLLSINEP